MTEGRREDYPAKFRKLMDGALRDPELGPQAVRLFRYVEEHLDAQGYARLAQRHENDEAEWDKYLYLPYWLLQKLGHAVMLGLHRRPGLRILDLGTGVGHFLYVCRALGHETVGLDLDDSALFNELVDFLGLDRRVHAVRAFEPLPDLGGRFDLVTAFATCFDWHEGRPWGPTEWDWFLADLARNQLRPGGRVFMALNRPYDGQPYDEALRRYFEATGATFLLDGVGVLYDSMAAWTGAAVS